MTPSAPLRIGVALLDPAARTLTGPGGTARLTPAPLRLLVCMAALAPRVVPYPEAIACLDNRYGRADAETVRGHLRAVRAALRDSGAGVVAEAVYGVGIRLRVPDAPEAGTFPREAA